MFLLHISASNECAVSSTGCSSRASGLSKSDEVIAQNTRKRKPNEARGRSVAWTAVTCSQELSGLAIGTARPGKLVHHRHNLTYVHPIY